MMRKHFGKLAGFGLVLVCAIIAYAQTPNGWLTQDFIFASNAALTAASGKMPNGNGTVYVETFTPTLGTSTGSAGKLSFGSPNSGTVTLQTDTGPVGTKTVTLPLNTGVIPSCTQSITFSGLTNARMMTLPDASATLARSDAANTFTGIQTFSTPIATASVAAMTATVGGGVPTPPNNTTTFLRGDGTFAAPATSSAAGGGSGTIKTSGLLNSQVNSLGNGADTTEDDLHTYSIPASTFNNNGQVLRFKSYGTFASTTNSQNLRLYFGGTLIGTITATVALSGQWEISGTISRTGNNTQWVSVVGFTDATATTTTGPTTGLTLAITDTAGITIKTTAQEGTAGTANHITEKGFHVWFDNY